MLLASCHKRSKRAHILDLSATFIRESITSAAINTLDFSAMVPNKVVYNTNYNVHRNRSEHLLLCYCGFQITLGAFLIFFE